MERKHEVSEALSQALVEQEKALQIEAKRCKERLDGKLAEQKKARAELPQLRKTLGAKRRQFDRLQTEILSLENRVGMAEQMVDTDGIGGFGGMIAREKRDYEAAKTAADTFIQRKVKELTQ